LQIAAKKRISALAELRKFKRWDKFAVVVLFDPASSKWRSAPAPAIWRASFPLTVQAKSL